MIIVISLNRDIQPEAIPFPKKHFTISEKLFPRQNTISDIFGHLALSDSCYSNNLNIIITLFSSNSFSIYCLGFCKPWREKKIVYVIDHNFALYTSILYLRIDTEIDNKRIIYANRRELKCGGNGNSLFLKLPHIQIKRKERNKYGTFGFTWVINTRIQRGMERN